MVRLVASPNTVPIMPDCSVPPYLAWIFLVSGTLLALGAFVAAHVALVSDEGSAGLGVALLALGLWLAVDSVAIFLVYAFRAPRALGKTHTGKLRWAAIAFWLPLLFVLWAVYVVRHHLLDRCGLDEEIAHEVTHEVYVGRLPFFAQFMGTGKAVEFCKRLESRAFIVDLTSEFAEPALLARPPSRALLGFHVDHGDDDSDEYYGDGGAVQTGEDPYASRVYRWVPALDMIAPSVTELVAGVQEVLMFQHKYPDAPVFVHCANGHGRSAAFAACLLVAMGRADGVDEAERIMQRARKSIHLQPRQRSACLAAASILLAGREMGDDSSSGTGESSNSLLSLEDD